MNHSIRAKVVLITVALLVFAIGMNAAASGYVLTSKVTQALQSETLVIGQTLRLQLDKLLRLGIPVENLVGFEEQCQDVVAEHENISYAMVVDADGTILFHNDPAQHGTVLTDSAVLEAVQSTENTFRAYSSQGKRYYDAIIPVLGIHGEHIAAVRIGFPAKLVAEETRGLVVHTVGVAVLSLGVATALLIYGLSSWVTNPLMTLLTVIQEIRREGTTGLTRRVTIDSEDEIGHLASAFNQMIGDLQKSHEKVEQYAQELESKNQQLERDIAARQRAEEALQEAHAELERRVEERTAQLSDANALLKQEIVERERAEEQLQRYAAELEQANEEVKQFAYIVSHDLRVPLVNLQGFAAELRAASEVVRPAIDDVLSHVDPGQRQAVKLALQEDIPEALDFIDSSVACMDEFITAVLKLSRIGRRELKPEPIDVKAIVQATLQTLTHQIEAHQGQVTVEPLPQVVADRTSMEQVWGNILSNAVKYLDPDRPLRIEVTAERNHDEITFHVRDNGRGIAAEDMDKVFAPFRRAGRQDIPGEGMGLAYVQALVRRHGGRIWCESEPGLGTTFAFTIPSQSALSRNEIRRHVE